MDKKSNREFIEKVEKLVQPEDVNTISFLGDLNKIFPLKVQNEMVRRGASNAPYMGFIVDPYCFYLTYEIKDIEAAKKYIPEGYDLVPTKVFEDEEDRNLLIVGTFSARTSAFTGIRSEFYLITREKKSGRTAWMIIDYETNTNTYDPSQGFSGYSLKDSFFTTTSHGELLLKLNSKENGEILRVSADLTKSETRKLSNSLWLEHNYHTDYGVKLRGDNDPVFSIVFDPVTMHEALDIPLDGVEVSCLKFFGDVIDCSIPVNVAAFPYTQHFFIENKDPVRHNSPEELESTIERFVGIKNMKTMSGNALKKPLKIGLITSMVINLAVITILILKLL